MAAHIGNCRPIIRCEMESLFDKDGFFRPPWWDAKKPLIVRPEHKPPPIHPNCWLGNHGKWEGKGEMPACDGILRKCHLIPQQILKRHLPEYLREKLLWDPAVWVWGCGGSAGYGNSGHHGHLDSTKKLRVPFSALPPETITFARKHDLLWWLERTYQRRARAHPLRRGALDGDPNR